MVPLSFRLAATHFSNACVVKCSIMASFRFVAMFSSGTAERRNPAFQRNIRAACQCHQETSLPRAAFPAQFPDRCRALPSLARLAELAEWERWHGVRPALL